MVTLRFIYSYILVSFFIWILAGALFFFFSGADVAKIWLIVSFPFFFFILGSYLIKHNTLIVFYLATFLACGVGSPLFFIYKDNYNATGFNAVGRFDFSVSHYLEIYSYVFLFLFFTGISVLFLKVIFPTRYKFNNELAAIKFNVSTNYIRYIIIMLAIMGSMSFLHIWMFNNSIAITGVNPPRLPFRLTGILYFFTRFVIPLVLMYLYSKTNRGYLISFALLFYALFVALTQVSRTTLTMYFLPVCFFSFFDKKYLLFSITICLFFVFFPVIDIARNFVYLIEDGTVYSNQTDSISKIVSDILSFKTDDISVGSSIAGFIGRLGGTQDVVLAYQYDNSVLGNSWLEFTRVFFFSDRVDTLQVQSHLYGIIPHLGFSTGDGTLTACMLIIAGKNLFNLFLVSFWIGLLVHFHEVLICFLPRKINFKSLIYLLAIVFNMILVPRLNFLILYGYLFVLLIGIILVKFLFAIRFNLKNENTYNHWNEA